MPNVETVDIPFVLHAPKPRFKSEVPVSVKSGKRQVTQEKTPEELQAEMELHKADYILPLQVCRSPSHSSVVHLTLSTQVLVFFLAFRRG